MTKSLPVIRPIAAKHLGNAKLNSDWVFEFKYDGYRAMLHLDGPEAFFVSKSCRRMSSFGEFAQRLRQKLRPDQMILDGEIVVLDPVTGRPDFSQVRHRHAVLHYVAFDLLYLDGEEWWQRPYVDRKRMLATLIKNQDGLMASEFWEGRPMDMAEFIQRNNLEGLVAKRKQDQYRAGTRWLKLVNPNYDRRPSKGK